MTWGSFWAWTIVAAVLYPPVKRGGDRDAPAADSDETVAKSPGEAPPDDAPLDKEALIARLRKLDSRDSSMAHYVATRLAQLPPDEGFAILKENWASIPSYFARSGVLHTWRTIRPFPRNWSAEDPSMARVRPRNHPRLLDALDLGMRDPSPVVQNAALTFLMATALQDFSEDFQTYERWYRANREKPVETVVVESLQAFVASVKDNKDADPEAISRILEHGALAIYSLPNAEQVAQESGLAELLSQWIAEGRAETEQTPRVFLAYSSLRLLKHLKMNETYLRSVLLPLMSKEANSTVRRHAVPLLGRKEFPWAVKTLRELLESEKNFLLAQGENGSNFDLTGIATIARSLAEAEDTSAVPAMIAVVSALDNYDAIHSIGVFGLAPLTGVRQNDLHDGAWWRAWWEKNKTKYPPEIREQKFPIHVRAPEEPEET